MKKGGYRKMAPHFNPATEESRTMTDTEYLSQCHM